MLNSKVCYMFTWVKSAKRISAISTSFVLLMSAIAVAQEIPKELLELDRQRCSNECMKELNDAAICKQLCDCTVSEFKKRFSFDIYLDLSAELAQSKVSKDNRKKLDDIARMCSANIKWPETRTEPKPVPLPKPSS